MLENSIIINEEKTKKQPNVAMGLFLIKIMLIYTNFNFDFHGWWENVYFENNSANEHIAIVRFLTHLKHSQYVLYNRPLKCLRHASVEQWIAMQSGKHVQGQNLSRFVLNRKLCDVSTSEGYSWGKHKEKSQVHVSYLYMWYRFLLIYINFNFDFHGLDNVYFENYFANNQITSLVFKPFKTLAVRALSEYKTLDCVSFFISDKALLLVF